MNDYVKALFASNVGCVKLRIVFTLIFILYQLSLLSWNNFTIICKLLYIPLLVAIFGEDLSCLYFQLKNKMCLKLKLMVDKEEQKIYTKNNKFVLEFLRVFYKLVILYLIIKYIKPEFDYVIILSSILLYLYLQHNDVLKLHLNMLEYKKIIYNPQEFNTFLILSSLVIFCIFKNLYNYLSNLKIFSILVLIKIIQLNFMYCNTLFCINSKKLTNLLRVNSLKTCD